VIQMLDKGNAAVLIVDMQDSLLQKISVGEAIVQQAVRLISFSKRMELPVLWAEQYPKGLGRTTEPIAAALEGHSPIEKTSFGCMGDFHFAHALRESRRRQILLAGVETHVCVLQTVLGAMDAGYEAYVLRDAVASREKAQHKAGLERMRHAGVHLVTAEMAMFELLREAGTPEFKAALPLLKGEDEGQT
jgi:nicotinamidase-related amidase